MVTKRMQKVNAEVARAISEIINYRLENPKIKESMITVLAAQVTQDMKYAKVFVSIFDTTSSENVLNALKQSVPFIRRNLAKMVKLRIVPEIRFSLDDSMEYASNIDKLLNDINKKK